jgi:hypothetical protein
MDIQVIADVPLKLVKGHFTGQAPLKHSAISASVATCQVTASTQDSTLQVLKFDFSPSDVFDVDCPGQDPAPPNDYDVVIDVGDPKESFSIQCPSPVPAYTGNGEIWRSFFYLDHPDWVVSFGGSQFQITGWDNKDVLGYVLGQKLYQNGIPGLNENTFIFLLNANH